MDHLSNDFSCSDFWPSLIHITNDPDEAARAPVGDAIVADVRSAAEALRGLNVVGTPASYGIHAHEAHSSDEVVKLVQSGHRRS